MKTVAHRGLDLRVDSTPTGISKISRVEAVILKRWFAKVVKNLKKELKATAPWVD